jgi:cytochrome c oxidase subunit 3
MDQADDPGGGHPPAREHPPFLAHHFETPKQQFEAGKLGMWIFLVTEVLLFGGLFCAYAVFRSNHPEIFQYAQQFLDKGLGALNTGVLITSSLTMAWAVRCAQLGRRRALVALLAVTLACGGVFLGVKYVEYRHKWHEGLLWAGWYNPQGHGEGEHSTGPSAEGQPEAAAEDREETPETTSTAAPEAAAGSEEIAPRNVGVFFSIYFLMTGLHGLHVVAGMGAIAWILVRSAKGHFGPAYFGPVDYVGLYWHLVDLIWIYLFPLLYLIHEAPGHP